jgi:hypothetical protein
MTNFQPCLWCKHNPGCENEDFQNQCEFKTLPFEKDAIMQRLKFEWSEIQRMRAELVNEQEREKAEKLARNVMDKSQAVQTMMGVLRVDFKMRQGIILRELKIERPGVVESVKLMAKLQKMKHERGGKK